MISYLDICLIELLNHGIFKISIKQISRFNNMLKKLFDIIFSYATITGKFIPGSCPI